MQSLNNINQIGLQSPVDYWSYPTIKLSVGRSLDYTRKIDALPENHFKQSQAKKLLFEIIICQSYCLFASNVKHEVNIHAFTEESSVL